MKIFIISALLLSSSVLLAPSPAQACSVGYEKGMSPQEIKRRDDVRKVTGVYRLKDVTGERFTNAEGEERIKNAQLVGEISTGSGRILKTVHGPPSELLQEICGVDAWYHKPEADADGTFWILRMRKNDRHRLLLWEGDYLREPEIAEKKD